MEASRLYDMLAVTLQREVPNPVALRPRRSHAHRGPPLGSVKLCACLRDPYLPLEDAVSRRCMSGRAVGDWLFPLRPVANSSPVSPPR